METYILLALISTLFFGLNTILLKVAPNIDPVAVILLETAMAVVVMLIFYMFFYHSKHMSAEGAIVAALSGIVYAGGIVMFTIALRTGKASIVASISALSAGVAVVLAIALLGERITLAKSAGVVLAIFAGYLLAS